MGNGKHDTMRDLTMDELENVGGGANTILYCSYSTSSGTQCHYPTLTELWINDDLW
jgi:hypothetical protein